MNNTVEILVADAIANVEKTLANLKSTIADSEKELTRAALNQCDNFTYSQRVKGISTLYAMQDIMEKHLASLKPPTKKKVGRPRKR
jgi:hypothetical protein